MDEPPAETGRNHEGSNKGAVARNESKANIVVGAGEPGRGWRGRWARMPNATERSRRIREEERTLVFHFN